MEPFDLYKKLTRPALADMLEILHLQYEFYSAEGDKMRGLDPRGNSIEVYDFLGGYGSTILGHNHPEILSELKSLTDQKLVFHAQASIRTATARLAYELNQTLAEETDDSRQFVMTASNSGAEAVEVALKHALLQWQNKKQEFILSLKSQFYSQKKINPTSISEIKKFLCTIEKAEPVVLAFKGGFHGKTAAAVAVTENPNYSSMYSRKTLDVHFLDREMAVSEIPTLVASYNVANEWEGHEIQFSRIVGLIYEPIQGEGGIFPLPSDLLQKLNEFLKKRAIPMIADEIQSGFYRTGQFLASTAMGIKPDYILLGKSLGGGVSKIGATLIAKDHYQEEFGWVHTSTFAEDDWSSRIALKSLELLRNRKSETKKSAVKFERKICEIVKSLQDEFPGIIKSVRGSGFFMGLEFNFEDKSLHSSFLHFVFENGYATYLLTSYLLHKHKIRLGVTLSAPSTLRLEPSAFISDEALNQLTYGLRDVCLLLSEKKMAALLAHLWKTPPDQATLSLVSDSATSKIQNVKNIPRIGFISHAINLDWMRQAERAFSGVPDEELEKFLKLYFQGSSPALYHEQVIEGLNGEKVILNLYGLMVSSHQFEMDLRNRTKKTVLKVQEAVNLAAKDGCHYFGLGQFTSIVSQNGLLLDQPIPITTGNSLTAGMAFRAVQRVIKDRFLSRPDLKIGVVGFTGNICLVVSQLLADLNYPMTLVYREPYETSEKFKSAVQTLLFNSHVSFEKLTFAHQISAVHDCDIILVGTNSSQEFILSEHIKFGAVILDISVPTNVHSSVRKRSDVLYFQGGFARFPFDQKVEHNWCPTFSSKNWYACMAETLVCGLLAIQEPFSLGALSKARVIEALAKADQLGVELGDLRRG